MIGLCIVRFRDESPWTSVVDARLSVFGLLHVFAQLHSSWPIPAGVRHAPYGLDVVTLGSHRYWISHVFKKPLATWIFGLSIWYGMPRLHLAGLGLCSAWKLLVSPQLFLHRLPFTSLWHGDDWDTTASTRSRISRFSDAVPIILPT